MHYEKMQKRRNMIMASGRANAACRGIGAVVRIFILAASTAAWGQNMVLKITAANPAASTNKVVVRELLPPGIGKAEVLDPAGMELRYERTQNLYYLYVEEEIPPYGNREYDVIVRDVWTIPQERIDELRTQSAEILKELAKTDVKEAAAALKRDIDALLDKTVERQNRYKIGGAVTASVHIKSYEKTAEMFEKAREKVGELEDYANTYVIKLNRMLGPLPPLPEREREQGSAGTPGTFVVEIRNPARTDASIPVRKYFPPELGPEDFAVEGDLEVRYDSDREACYLFTTGIPVKAEESVFVTVTVANKWTINSARYAEFYVVLTNLQAVGKVTKIEYLQNRATQLLSVLAGLRNVEAPAKLDDSFILFYREQTEALDLLERELLQLARILKPQTKRRTFDSEILNVQPPSRKTTWRIIYVVLAFLGVVSILFFLRWYGKSKDETLT